MEKKVVQGGWLAASVFFRRIGVVHSVRCVRVRSFSGSRTVKPSTGGRSGSCFTSSSPDRFYLYSYARHPPAAASLTGCLSAKLYLYVFSALGRLLARPLLSLMSAVGCNVMYWTPNYRLIACIQQYVVNETVNECEVQTYILA